ncbi:MAG: hypothetical protein WAU03_03150 [Candidatus Saccharimonas aalborgensis]
MAGLGGGHLLRRVEDHACGFDQKTVDPADVLMRSNESFPRVVFGGETAVTDQSAIGPLNGDYHKEPVH